MTVKKVKTEDKRQLPKPSKKKTAKKAPNGGCKIHK